MSWLTEVERALGAQPVRRIGSDERLRRAAVLVPLFIWGGSLWILLTRRAGGLRHHPGEITFPGGSAQEGDEDEIATALREAEEELGLERGMALLLGHLNDVRTETGFVISPVVAAVPWPVELRPCEREVADVLPMPLGALARPTLVEAHEAGGDGETTPSPVLHYGARRIGGATARILIELLDRLRAGEADAGVPGPTA